MLWASAISRTPSTGTALGEVAEQVHRDLTGRPPHLLFVFVTPHHGTAFDRVPAVLGERFPDTPLAGCSARGVIGAGREVEGAPALSLTAGWLPGVEVRTFYRAAGPLPADDAGPEAWAEALGLPAGMQPHLLLFADSLTADLRPLLAGLDAAFPDRVRVGGVASGGQGPGSMVLFHDGHLKRAGTVGVALAGDIAVDTVVAQGDQLDAQSADRDLRDTLDRYRDLLGDARPRGGLLFSCVGRGQGLYGEPHHDSTAFHDHVGPAPLGGFFCNGEIGPVQGRTWLHGQASAFALFRPGGPA